MNNTPIATLGDTISPHAAGSNPAYFVNASKIVGGSGAPAPAAAVAGLSSGSTNIFAEGRAVHRKGDVTGDSHYSMAINPADDPVVGFVPCETIKTLSYKMLYNMHHQPYLVEGSPSVFANGKSVGFHGATYVCSGVVEARPAGVTASVFVPKSI